MLQLKSLQLFGFKSFAEKTRVQFGPGISCMIGPNGCGKSNLADAIGWVLGLQSAHSLRGERMEDVIFSGTRKRRPSGLVETRLVFGRPDDQPIVLKDQQFSAETLEVSRKLYRSGESIYSINKQRCRLKDVRAALEEGGLGFASYAVIAQGKIDWFLSAKALDRRTAIEEAAQITGYKSRRRSAELKLEMAQQNLLRVNDIVVEIERQLRSLKRQAAKARRYRETKERFRLVLAQKLVLQAGQLRGRLEVLDGRLQEHKALELELGKRLAEREQAHREALAGREKEEVELSQLRQKLSDVRLELDRAKNSIRHHQDQVGATHKALEVNAEERRSLTQSLQKVEGELARFKEECAALDREGGRIDAEVEKHSQQVSRCRSEMEAAENRLDDLRSQLVRLSAQTASLKNLQEHLLQRLPEVQSTHQRLERERSQYRLQLEENAARLNDSSNQLKDRKSRIDQARRELENQEAAKNSLERQLAEIAEQTDDVQSRVIAQRERLHSLQEIELSHSQYSEGVQNLLKHLGANQALRTGGTLADVVETSAQYERLVEEFLDKELEYILVDSFEDAVTGVSELKTIKSGRCTFLTMSSSNGHQGSNGNGNGHNGSPEWSTEEGVHGNLSDLLEMESGVKAAFRRALPQRAQAVVVSDLGRAFQLAERSPETTFITLAGEALTPSGLLSASAASGKKLGLLSLKRRKKDLEGQIVGSQKQLKELQGKAAGMRRQLDEALTVFESNRESLLQLDKEIIGLTHRREQWEGEERRQGQALKVVEAELQRLALERDQLKQKLQGVENQLDSEKGTQATTDRMVLQTQANLQQLRVEFSGAQDQLHLVVSERKVLKERRLALERTLERVEEQRRGLKARDESTQHSKVQSEERLESMSGALQALDANLKQFQKNEQALLSDLGDKEREHENWKATYPEIEKGLLDLRDRKSDMQEQRGQLDVERARLDTQLQNLSQSCVEQLQISLEEASSQVETQDVTLDEVASECQALRDKLDTFGPINLAALDEYQESEERHNFLTSQRQDIDESIADTTRAIREINRRSRERFAQAFEAINGHFNQIFQKLFEGGECGMRLLDDEDPLESGIDLFAQPPGKKLQNVTLLSGGEKALTVFALLMAIFTYRPSRLCVLDEVDAPLDDTNVVRFTQLIREMSEQTQFMIISHNKRTMEIADSIYGVTMQEPGVSQIVSVDLHALPRS